MDTKARMFQYKVLHDTLYANKMLFKFGKVTSRPGSFCKLQFETIMHLFYDCVIVKRIWTQLKSILSKNVTFPVSATECHLRILGLKYERTPYLKPLTTYFQNVHLQSKNNRLLEYKSLLIYIKGIKGTEKKICENDAKMRRKINKK